MPRRYERLAVRLPSSARQQSACLFKSNLGFVGLLGALFLGARRVWWDSGHGCSDRVDERLSKTSWAFIVAGAFGSGSPPRLQTTDSWGSRDPKMIMLMRSEP